MQPITGVVQHYPWGDQRFIPELFGRQPNGTPWAELWLGTHPSGMSRLADGRDLTAATGTLPYLLKVLAAAEPLSLQTHPSAEQARAGYHAGRYPDPYPKPELLCALTDVRGLLRGSPGRRDGRPARGRSVCAASPPPSSPPGWLPRSPRCSAARSTSGPIVDACATSGRPEARWAVELAGRYPGDTERRRDAPAQLRPARTRRGDPARPREPALLPRRRRHRADGGERQRRTGGIDGETDRRRRRARGDGPDPAPRPGDVGVPGLPARRHVDQPAPPRRSGRATGQDP